jgi:hypothetical protein
MTPNQTLDNLIVVRDQRSALIRAELRAGKQRHLLENAVRDAIRKLGNTVDEVSDASGLTTTEIHRILDEPTPMDSELDALSGVC